MIKNLIPILLLALMLVACQSNGDGPRQIASYPNQWDSESSQTYTPPVAVSPTTILVYDASLDLAVWNIDDTANAALQKAADYGGYLSASFLWNADGKKYASLTFALPAGNYDHALTAFKRLGTVNREQVSGKLYSPYSGQSGWEYTSHITLNLSPRFKSIEWPFVEVTDARPMRTLSTAFGVLVGLLGFLLDVVIWLTVVVGPFVFVGWGVRKVWCRMRKGQRERKAAGESK